MTTNHLILYSTFIQRSHTHLHSCTTLTHSNNYSKHNSTNHNCEGFALKKCKQTHTTTAMHLRIGLAKRCWCKSKKRASEWANKSEYEWVQVLFACANVMATAAEKAIMKKKQSSKRFARAFNVILKTIRDHFCNICMCVPWVCVCVCSRLWMCAWV